MGRVKNKITTTLRFATYASRLLYRNLLDFFVATEIAPTEPIVIRSTEVALWMIGHSTVLINLYGTTILTDPVLSFGLPFPKRLVRHGYNIHELPPLDYIVISHTHLDHCNRPTLRRLAKAHF